MLAALVAVLSLAPLPVQAQDLRSYAKTASFEDVKFDLTNAVTNRGLVIDFTGNVGGMLERTGKDLGAAKTIYARAEYIVFCSAKLSRDMMEADAANVGYCPYVMFIYQAIAKPGQVVVGYRRLPVKGNAASRKAFAAVNALLDGLARDVVK